MQYPVARVYSIRPPNMAILCQYFETILRIRDAMDGNRLTEPAAAVCAIGKWRQRHSELRWPGFYDGAFAA